MQQAGILAAGSFLPERVMRNRQWEVYNGASAEWISSRTGIEERRMAAEGETTVDLAVEAAKDALAKGGFNRDEVTELLVATDTPEVFSPDTAAYVQHHLELSQIPAYDLGASGCTGFIQGLAIAASRVRDEGGKVLVIAAELISRIMDWGDRRVAPLFGNGAGAVIVGASSSSAILACYNATDGGGADALSLEVGGTRAPVTPERVAINLDRYGDTGSAAFPIALDEALQSGRIAPGDHVLLVAFGAGFHWGGAVIHC